MSEIVPWFEALLPRWFCRLVARHMHAANGSYPNPRLASAIRSRADMCDHDWHYDAEESRGPWTGYIERCAKCGELQQVPQ